MPGVTNYETPDQEYARLQRESDEITVEELTATEDDDPTSWRFVGTTANGGTVYVGPGATVVFP